MTEACLRCLKMNLNLALEKKNLFVVHISEVSFKITYILGICQDTLYATPSEENCYTFFCHLLIQMYH